MTCLGQRVLLGLSLTIATGAVGAAPVGKPATFDCEWVVRSATYGIIERAQMTSKGQMLRLQKRTGAGLKILFIRNRQGTYHINVHTNDGAKWPAAWARDADRRLLSGGPMGDPYHFLKIAEARRTGRTKVGGRAADVWTYTIPSTSGRSQVVRVFMGVKEKRPLKTEMRMPVAPGRDEVATIEYKTYRWGMPLPDSHFNLPPGAKLVDLGNPSAGPIVVPGGPKRKPAPVKKVSAALRRAP